MSKDMDEATNVAVINCDEEIDELRRSVRHLTRKANRLEQQANRVKNLVPGRGRIHMLDQVVMLFDIEADILESELADDLELAGTELEDKMMSSDERAVIFEQVKQSRALSLSVKRLEWDLGKLRDAVRGDERRMTGNRNDPGQWVGPRP